MNMRSPSIGRMQWSTVQDSPLNEDVAVRIVVVLKLMSIDEILSDVFLVAMNVQL